MFDRDVDADVDTDEDDVDADELLEEELESSEPKESVKFLLATEDVEGLRS